MDSFELKINSLSQKLNNLPNSKKDKRIVNAQDLYQTVTDYSQVLSRKSDELQRRYQNLFNSLSIYESQLNKLLTKCSQHLEKVQNERQDFDNTQKQKINEKQQYIQNLTNKLIFQSQEKVESERFQFDIKVRNLKKQIDREKSLFEKQIGGLSDSPELNFLETDNKIYKQFYLKVSIIEQNQRMKAQKINQTEIKLSKRIDKLFGNISTRIQAQEKQNKAKNEKIKRLLALVTDIS